MAEKTPYSFTVLRYVHDVVTGEFVNVGLVLQDARSGKIHSKFRTSMGRARAAFPGLDRVTFLSAMKSVRKGLSALSECNLSRSDPKKAGLESGVSDVGGWARLVLPDDDSALQWSPVSSGLTDDIESTTERLYERFVVHNDSKSKRTGNLAEFLAGSPLRGSGVGIERRKDRPRKVDL